MTSKASSTGTLVKTRTTSNHTETSLFRIVDWFMCRKAAESFAYKSVVPFKGFRILTSSLASWCVIEPNCRHDWLQGCMQRCIIE